MNPELVSVVLPVYNQADHLREVVHSYQKALARIPIASEIILVPNGCRDESVAICHELEGELHAVVAPPPGRGWGLAVNHGLGAARGDLLCYTNLARTSPEDLALLILYALANPGVVIKANRRIRDSLFRRLGGLLYNLEGRALFGLAQWDLNGTPKIFPRSFGGLLCLERDDDLIDLEFNVVCAREGYRVIEVPILCGRRHGGRSTTTLSSAAKMYWGAIRLHSQMRTERR